MDDNDHDNSTEIVLISEDVLPVPDTLNFEFQGINYCIQIYKLPDRKAQLNMASNIMV